MKSVLDQPVRVDRRGEHIYFYDGAVCVDVQSGTTEQRKAVLDLLAQAQVMARVLLTIRGEGGAVTEGNLLAVRRVLREARLLPSDAQDTVKL